MGIKSTTWKHIRRSPYQAIAAILTMFITFLLGGFFFLASTVSELALSYFESKPQITVFFQENVERTVVDALELTLQNTGKIASVTFVSKEEALAIYQKQNKNDPLLLEMVTADILPASLEVTATDPTHLGELESLVKQAEGVEDVVYQKDVVDALISWTNAIRFIGGSLAGLLAIDSILIVMTVIGMKIALRREEIEILKLVGASPWYIRMPFVLEGGLYGVLGSFFAWALLIGLIMANVSYLLSFLGAIEPVVNLIKSPLESASLVQNGIFLGGMMGLGFLLGAIGSLISVGRYLRF